MGEQQAAGVPAQRPVIQPCPLEFTLSVQVRIDPKKHAKDSWPSGKIRIKFAANKTEPGVADVCYARVGSAGTSAVEEAVRGHTDRTFYVSAEGVDSPWQSTKVQKVEVKKAEKKTVVVDLEPQGGGLIVELSRFDGEPLKRQLSFRIEGPEKKDAQATEAWTDGASGARKGRKVYRGLRPGDYTVSVADLDALLKQEDQADAKQKAITWKLGPSKDGKVKVKVEKGVTATVSFTLTKYTQAQFIAFDVMPGTGKDNNDHPVYLGDPDNFDDLGRRLLLMKKAMRTALRADGVDDGAHVLKIFMAPEFYWRGRDGAYQIGATGDGVVQVDDIMAQLRPIAQHADFSDWLFVYGTAIGYLKHGDGNRANTFRLLVKSTGEWKDAKVKRSTVNVIADPALEAKDASPALICGRIPPNAEEPIRWKVDQGTKSAGVLRSERVSDLEYKLYLDAKVELAKAAFQLSEPISTEVFNLALVQRGGPPPYGRALSEAIVYKEFVSHIDFLGANSQDIDAFHEPSGSGRRVLLAGEDDRRMLPTEGATDVLGAAPNKPGGRVSEVSKTGLGGGGVFVMDGITFGIEVCRDHAQNRLFDYYAKHARAGEPKVQISLIPSWGMKIEWGPICAVHKGLVFNVDGPAGSVAVVYDDPQYRCPFHPGVLKPTQGTCPENDYFCCRKHVQVEKKPGDCPSCKAPLVDKSWYRCVKKHHFLDPQATECQVCKKPATATYRCAKCSLHIDDCPCLPGRLMPAKLCRQIHRFAVDGTCCGEPLKRMAEYVCDRHEHRQSAAGKCRVCGRDLVESHELTVQGWTKLESRPKVPVPDLEDEVTIAKVTKKLASKHAELFQRTGAIFVFPAKDIPGAETV